MNQLQRFLGTLMGAMLVPVTLWSQSVIINEIHYDEDDPTVHSEFVELHNPGTTEVALGGWYFSDGPPFVFPAGTVLAPGGFLVVAEDAATLQSKWGVSGAGVFDWNAGVVPPVYGQLKNSGDAVVLRTASGAKVNDVEYQLGFPWPTVGDPPNFSIELINPSLDNTLGGSWRRSDGGTDTSPARAFVSRGSTGWRYRKATSEASSPIPAWRAVDFPEDDSWQSGLTGAPLGYPASVNIKTLLGDMRMTATVPGYTGIYLRHEFEMTGPAPGPLKLRVYSDDGFVAWLNGQEVARFGPLAGTEVTFDALAGRIHSAGSVETVTLSTPNALLNIGTTALPATNVLTIHALNTSISDTDFSIDAELKFDGDTPAGAPTPRAVNSVLASNAPPAIRQVDHLAVGAPLNQEWPKSGQEVRVTAKITDPQGVGEVALSWQVVEPGDYIKLDDARYEAPASWTRVLMRDDGTSGDVTAGDAIYSAVIPAAVQSHRRLIRYRIAAVDALAAPARAPRIDDTQPNFAYYVYDGVPAWTGKAKPTSPDVTYPPDVLSALPAYHLVTRVEEHANAQQVPVTRANGTTQAPAGGAYTHSLYNWQGALCYDGRVYDHIRYRARGGVWRFAMGKNMWKFDFNRGHDFQARDDYGRSYDQKWKKLNFSACIQQGDFNSRGEHGLYESVGFRLFQLTGMPAEHTQSVHFRIVERPLETNGTPSQFDDDFQGLYLGIEQQDGQFLDEHGLPDGNLYKMESGTGELNNTGPTGPKNKSDLTAFIGGQGYSGANGTKIEWWRANCDLPNYYNYRAIVDCIHHYDIGDGKNYFYYRNPLSAQWTALPWDLDLTWDNGAYRADNGIAGLSPSGNTTEPFFSKVFGGTQAGAGPIPELRQELRNRVREVLDLLFTPEQAGMLIDEKAAAFYQPGQPSFADADRAQWDFTGGGQTFGMVTGGSAATRIAGYDNAVEIGRGGFAVVYRARRVEFDQDVAIKVLDPTTADEHGVARLARERRILGLLAQHPNVVTVYDAGMTADGAQYLVMEYLAGGSLGDRLAREGPLDVRRVVDYAVRLCGALETAHRAGVLHRDIKPDNILVSRFGEPVLADFGIARVQGGMQTRSGVITATVSHAPPEVLDGYQPTARSDVYSFASTVFTMLAGGSPFARPGDHGITPLIARILRDPVPDLRPRGIPAQVCALLERAMAKHPDDRQTSAVELGQGFQRVQRELGWPVSTMVVEDLDPADLEVPDPEPGPTASLLPPDPTTVPPNPTTIRTERPAGRRRRRLRLLLIATAVVTVVALAAVIVVPLLASPPPSDPPTERRGGPGTVTFAGAVNPAPGRADLEVLDFGFTPVPTGTGSWLTGYAIRLRNPNPDSWLVSSVTLTIRFTDDRGVVLGDGQELTSYTIVPNGTDAVGPDLALSAYDGNGNPIIDPPAYTIRPTRMNIEVGDVTWDRVDTRVPGGLTASPAELRMRPDEPGSFGSRADVECALTSAAAVLIDPVIVTVVLRDEAGAIVGGEEAHYVTDATGQVTGVDVTPAATTPLNLRLDSVPPAAVSAECYPGYVLPAL